MQGIRRRLDEEGLTLIEILVVVIVLGILAGIVIFAVGTFRGDTARAACQTDAKSVEVAGEAFRAKGTRYPSDIPEIVASGYLKAPPPTNNYGISVSAATPFAVTATLTADNGGGSCFP